MGKHPNHRMNPRSLANLKPWEKGQSGNPAGRPAAGATVREWINVMGEWTVAVVEAVLDDKEASVAKVAAAKLFLSAVSDDGLYARDKDGKLVCTGERSGPGKSFDRIMDRTVGKPPQEVLNKGDMTVYVKRTFVEPRK